MNKEAVRLAILAATALKCEIDPLVKFDRKNYYYSDLPKGYQITQQFHPIGRGGVITIDTEQGKKIFVSTACTWRRIQQSNSTPMPEH